MYRTPSSRRKKKGNERLNLTPVMDAVFIFIFFLLMSASFTKIFEIASDVPMISDKEPPKDKKPPLALTIQITEKGFNVMSGIPSRMIKQINKVEKDYNFEELHTFLVEVKKANLDEKTAILEPLVDATYEDIVKVMDAARLIKKTDEALFIKDKDGLDVKVEELFSNIVFGNIQS